MMSCYWIVWGVVTSMLLVEAFATKIFDKNCAWLLDRPFPRLLKSLIHSDSKHKVVGTPPYYCWFLDFVIPWSPWSLDSVDWLLKITLITWYHFDACHKHFYRRTRNWLHFAGLLAYFSCELRYSGSVDWLVEDRWLWIHPHCNT